jgi:hypothetical protein
MSPSDVRAVGALHFLMSDELQKLLEALPRLMRRLSTTTAHEEDRTADRIRGSIQWPQTFAARATGAAPNVYVTSPSRRAFQTPENELLVFVLDETVRLGRASGWHRSTSTDVGQAVNSRVSVAQRWLQARMLAQVERRPVTTRSVVRVRTGRSRRRYMEAIAAYDVYRYLVGSLDRSAIREAIETRGLATRDDPTLFELVCTFDVLRTLAEMGWQLERFGLVEGSLKLRGLRGSERLELAYQHTPAGLSVDSVYREAQRAHAIHPGALRPDLVIHRVSENSERWLMIEIKGGERQVEDSARQALKDLLGYRAAFEATLSDQPSPFGLGIAWGEGLDPASDGEIMLCTPDTLRAALAVTCS